MGLRTPHLIGLLSRNESRSLMTAQCSYCGSTARWAQHECRSCGAPIEWPKELDRLPTRAFPPVCATGEDPR